MIDDIKKLRTLMDTYKLSRPVSPELQQFAIESRIPDLRRILMKAGKYSAITWLVIIIFTLFRKYGLHITLIQSKIIAAVTAAAVASGSAAVAYRGAKYVIEATTRPASQIEKTIDRSETEKIKQIENVAPDESAEQKQTMEKQSIPLYKEKTAPAVKKQPASGKPQKVKRKMKEHNTISDIPSL